MHSYLLKFKILQLSKVRDDSIAFVWSQYDGGNIEQRTIGYGCRQNQEAKEKIVGGVF